MTTYLIDAKILIQAKILHCGFWTWLNEQNSAGKVASID